MELLDYRVERAPLAMRRAERPHFDMRLVLEPVEQSLNHARLPDAGLTGDQQDATGSRFGLLPAPDHQVGLLFSADQRCVRGTQRPKTVGDFGRFDDPPGFNRHCEAFESLGVDRGVLEKVPDDLPGLGADHDGVRLGASLKAGREVGRFAHHVVALLLAGADQVSDQDQAACNADSRLQRPSDVVIKLPDVFDQPEPRIHRAFGVVLACPRISEISEHAVAQILCNEAVRLRKNAHAAFAISRYDFVKRFRIETGGKFRRSD